MEAWLIPVSLFTKKYLSINTLAVLPFLVYVMMFVYLILSRRGSLEKFKVSKGMFIFTLIFLASQTLVVFLTYYKVQHDPSSPNLFSGIFFGIYLLTANIIIVALLIKFLINDVSSELTFYKGIYWTLFGYSLFVLLPQLFVVLLHVGNQWVNFVARLFEEQHPGRLDFYFNGSYTTTLGRINGFCSEASFLAAQLGIVFLPIIISSIKNRVNLIGVSDRYAQAINWFSLLFIWLILLFAKTSTGILVIVLSVIILFVTSNLSTKVRYTVLGSAGVVALAVCYVTVTPVRDIINNYLIHKGGVSNRLGGTVALLLTFINHPILGVGTGYESYYLMRYVPESTTNNWEFQNVFTQSGYPVQSVFFDFFARYGMIIMLPVIIYIIMKTLDAHKVKKYYLGQPDKTEARIRLASVDAFYFFLVIYLVVSLFSFGWYNSYYIIMFFFYFAVINNGKKSITIIS